MDAIVTMFSKRLLLPLIAVIGLGFAQFADAAIAFRCVIATPADNGTLSDATGNITIDKDAGCLSTAQSGDLIAIQVVQRDGNPTLTVGTSGGQTWTAEALNSPGASVSGQTFWARFNGTWTADPVFNSTANFGGAISAISRVFIPTNPLNTWAVDVAQSLGSATPTTPFDVTITGQTAVASSTVTTGCWFLTNSTATTWTLQTAGWANPNSEAQWRNQQGTDISVSCAYKINTSAGATGNVANRQATATGIVTYWNVETFKEVAAPPAPAFSVAPSVNSDTDVAITFSFTADSSSTAHCIALADGTSAPSASAVIAHTGALAFNSKAVTGADTLTISSLTFPLYDFYCALTNANGNSAVSSVTDEFLDPPAGKQFKTLTSVSATSFCNDISSPSVAANDIVVIDAVTTPGAQTVDILVDCNLSFFSDGSRQKIVYSIYDRSAQGYMSGSPGTLWYNNIPPACPGGTEEFHWRVGEAITPINFAALCPDAEGATLTCSPDVEPAGIDIASDCSGTGTPTVEDETGAAVTVTVTDDAGDSDTYAFLAYIIDQLPIPNVVGLQLSDAIGVIEGASFDWTVVEFRRSETVPAGEIIEQNPAAATEADPFTTIELVVSAGKPLKTKARSLGLGFGVM